MKKKLLSLLLALVMVLGLLPTSVLALGGNLSGEGTKDKPYLIEDADDLREFRDKVNAGEYTICGKLINDIDLNGESWTPIGSKCDGNATTYFAGTFDGNKKNISNFSISASYNHAGFFGYLKDSVLVKNLQIQNAAISSTSKNVGGIAGTIVKGTIENCSFGGSVTTTNVKGGYAGGIAGYMGIAKTDLPTIKNCVNNGAVTGLYSGGITGYAKYSAISNCYNTGAITGTTWAGGIAGQIMNNTSISNSYNIGSIGGSATNIGGITGWNGASISDCYWTKPETDSTGGTSVKVTNCEKIASAEGLLEKLGNAYVSDTNSINGGYPILSWQSDEAPPVPDTKPALSVTPGAGTIFVQSGAGDNALTLSASKKNMGEGADAPQVTWTCDNSTAARLETMENTADSVKVMPVEGGVAKITAHVTYQETEYTATATITVIPQVTTVKIKNVNPSGAVAMGQTVQAEVYVLGGKEYDYAKYPALTYRWAYKNSTNFISGETKQKYQIPTDYTEWVKLYVEVSCGDKVVRSAQDTCESIRSVAYGKLYPIACSQSFSLPTDVKLAGNLTLPTTQNGDGVIADLAWSSNNTEVISNAGVVTLPLEGKVPVTLTARCTYGDASANRTFPITVWSQKAVDEEASNKQAYLQRAVDVLGKYYTMHPVYGVDTNVTERLKADLAKKGFSDITVTMQSATSVYNGAGIDNNGNITYFYADPDTTRGVWFGQYKVSFSLSKDGVSLTYADIPVTMYWDVDRVKATMTTTILDKVTDATLCTGKDIPTAVTQNLTLPKVVEDKKWTQISWTSSNPNVISVSKENQSTAGTLFNPYVGVVKRGEVDQQVTLTATFTFQRANDVSGSEAPIRMSKAFPVTVKAMDASALEDIRKGLLAKLEAGFDRAGLSDAVTGKKLAKSDETYLATNDIQLPTTRDFGVDGKYYPITITSSDENVIVAPDVRNAARVTVYRPLPNNKNATATITVTMRDKDTSVTASKSFAIQVPALTQDEIKAEIALMDQVKAAYFDGINNGANPDANHVTQNLSSFQEVYTDAEGKLVWVRDNKDLVHHGIVPVPMDKWEELEAWRLFKSSNSAYVTHEDLRVSRVNTNKKITITSWLSSETLGKYAEKYPDNTDFQKLSKQPVDVSVMVLGLVDRVSAPVQETLDVSFTLQSKDSTWISKATLSNLPEDTTAYDVFKQLLDREHYTYSCRGSYITSITHPNGTKLEELDGGANSGWMYKVNGQIPNVYMGGYGLRDGDNVVMFFTKDYTEETGYLGGGWTKPTGTIKNPDGSTTTTEKKPDGTIVETKKSSDGRTEVVEKATDGTVTQKVFTPDGTRTETVKKLDGSMTATEKRKDGTELKSQTTPEGKTTATIVVPQDAGKISVTIPTPQKPRAGEVAVIIKPDGTREIVKTSVATDNGLRVTLPTGGKLEIVDNSKTFVDVKPTDWSATAVQFVASRELFQGVSEDNFAQTTNMTRAMLMTVLYRYDGANTKSSGDTWYADSQKWAQEIGISDGSNPDSEISREQLATIFYRYAGSPKIKINLNSYADAQKISGFARDAMQWAVSTGLIQGDGSGLHPTDNATRAEVSAILMRFCDSAAR